MLQVVLSRPGRDESQKWWFPPVLTPKDYTKLEIYRKLSNCNLIGPSRDVKKNTFTVTARCEMQKKELVLSQTVPVEMRHKMMDFPFNENKNVMEIFSLGRGEMRQNDDFYPLDPLKYFLSIFFLTWTWIKHIYWKFGEKNLNLLIWFNYQRS